MVLDRNIKKLAAAVVERAIIDLNKTKDEDICLVESDIMNGGLTFWLEVLDLEMPPADIIKRAKALKKGFSLDKSD